VHIQYISVNFFFSKLKIQVTQCKTHT